MEEKMIERINQKITKMLKEFEKTKKYNSIANAKVDGMIEILELATEKNYFYDETGVHER